MEPIHTLRAALVLGSLILFGCSGTPTEYPGYHYEKVNTGKRMDQELVSDRAENPRTTPEGERYAYVNQSKRVERVLLRDPEPAEGPHPLLIEVGADQVCPFCRHAYVTVGKHTEVRYFCEPIHHPTKPNPGT